MMTRREGARVDWSARFALERLRDGEPTTLTVRGRSMWPAITSGSRVEIRPCEARELQPGELGAFERAGSLVVHRVLHHAPGGVVFAGDARGQADARVPGADVLGRARVVRRRRLHLRWPRRRDWLLLARAARRLSARLRTHV